MYSDFVFLDRFLFELSCKHTHTNTHRDSNKYNNDLNIIQIMTGHKGNRKVYLARGKHLTIVQGEAEGNSQLFPGPTESREPDVYFSVG